jgi:hypothetical protein
MLSRLSRIAMTIAEEYASVDYGEHELRSLGWVSAIDSEGRTLWIVDAHRDNGKSFVVRSDELLTAFIELERVTHDLALSVLLGDDSHWSKASQVGLVRL